MHAPPHILLIDDDAQWRALIARELQRELAGAVVHAISGTEELARVLAACTPDAAIVDAGASNVAGAAALDLLQAIKARHADCAVIMFTASSSVELAVAAMKAGLDDYLVKPSSRPARLSQLLAALRCCLAQAERRQLSQDLHDNIMQTICAVGLSLEHSQRLIGDGQPLGAAGEIRWASATLKAVIQEIRQFIDRQSPLLPAAELQYR